MSDARFAFGYSYPVPKYPSIHASESATSMKACVYPSHGTIGALQMSFVDRPSPTARQLLIKVKSCSLNPVDVKLRSNDVSHMVVPLPKIQGCDFFGEIVEKDSQCSSRLSIGDNVFGMFPITFTGWGTCCQFLALDESLVAKAPNYKNPLELASLPLVGLTVLQGLRGFIHHHHGVTKGKKALIQAASGGVGTFAVQYCKNVLEMEVFATCSSKKADFVKSLGADHLIDYEKDNYLEGLSNIDLVLDPKAYLYEETILASNIFSEQGSFYINIASSSNTLVEKEKDPLGISIPEARLERIVGKKFKEYWSSFRNLIGFHGPFYEQIFVHPQGEMLDEIAKHVEEGKISPCVSQIGQFTIEDIRHFNFVIEEGHASGKLVIAVNDESKQEEEDKGN